MKKIKIIFVSLLVIIVVALLGVSNFMVNEATRPADNYGKDYNEAYRRVYEQYPEMQAWHDSLVAHGNWRDTTLVNAQGLKLHGIILEHDSAVNRSMMFIHGYCDDAPSMMRYAYCDYEMLGCNVILPERQNCGLSEGNHITWGYLDSHDMHLWAEMIHNLWPENPITIHGLSMGGATTLLLSGHEWPDSLRINGFIDDCGYTSAWEMMGSELKNRYSLPAFPLVHIANLINKVRNGWWFSDCDALAQVACSTKPMLFIHGDSDELVPTHMSYDAYEAKTQGYKELWITQNTLHAESIHNYWTEYCQRLQSFLDKISE